MRVFGAHLENVGTDSVINMQAPRPLWSCYVDGVEIEPFEYTGNSWLFCHSNSLIDGPHTITVNVTVTNNQTFWFDRIEYVPSPGVSLANKVISVDSPDPAMKFSDGWIDYVQIGNWTQTLNAVFAMNFYGM